MILYAAGGWRLSKTSALRVPGAGGENFLVSFGDEQSRQSAKYLAAYSEGYTKIEVPDELGAAFLEWLDGGIATCEAFEQFLGEN